MSESKKHELRGHNAARQMLPVGTQVVSLVDRTAAGELILKGAVGAITKAPSDPTHSYHVRLSDGREASFRRAEIAVRKEQDREGFRQAAALDLKQCIIYSCVVGSRAYGLDNEESDIDLRGIFLPPADVHWSLFGAPEQLESDENQECYWEIQKAITLALKANPTLLETLYSPLVEHATPLAKELLEIRSIFLSRLIYGTYNGYVMSQFKKLEGDWRNHGGIRWKHAMHLIRLLLSGITALRDGYVPVRVEQERDRLLAIRHGETPWEEVDLWRLDLHRRFEEAAHHTRLPEQPDYERANAFLIHARRSAVDSPAWRINHDV